LPAEPPVCAERDVHRAPPLQDLVRDYFQTQHVKLNCNSSTCSGDEARKDCAVILAPRVLILHVKRFRFETRGSAGFALLKLSDPVRIPEILDVSEVLGPRALGPSVFDQVVAPSKTPAATAKVGESAAGGPSHVRQRSMSVPGRARCNPPSPVAETVVDVDVDGPVTEDEGEGAMAGMADTLAVSPGCGFGIASQPTQILTPDDSQAPAFLCGGGPRAAKSLLAVATPSARGPMDAGGAASAAAPQRRHQFKVFGDSELTPSPERSPCRDAERPLSSGGTDSADAAGEEAGGIVDEVQDFEATQAPAAAARDGRSRDEELVTDLASRCAVPEGIARAALQNTSFSMTRAAGALVDVGAGRDRVGSVLELVERTSGKTSGACPSGKYRLSAVVRHCSTVAEYGHYVCDIRQTDGSWVCFDDSSADACGARPFEQESRMRDGYLFFYSAV
jgi:hypothetical protein